jgi:DNA repair protein RecN (Recombination protein N)
MLTQLSIKNFGLIDTASLDFYSGLNILTGETGAGKSILIDALRIVLGDKMSSSQVREPDKPCLIEAVFEINDPLLIKNELISEFIPSEENSLILHRTFSSDGKGKIRINGLNVTLAQLKSIGDLLVDFHGPHDHQMLLSENSHISMLDRLIDFRQLQSKYAGQYNEYIRIKQQLDELKHLAQTSEREREMLSYQIKELEQVPLDEDHYAQLLQDREKINHSEQLSEHTAQIIELLENGDNSPSELIRQSFRPMRSLIDTDPATSNLLELLDQLQNISNELLAGLHTYAETLNFDQQTAKTINEQYDIYDDIRRKYGPTLADARVFYDKAKEKFLLLSDLEHNDKELRDRMKEAEKSLIKTADEITQKRRKAAAELKKTIETELKELGIKNVVFEVKITDTGFMHSGKDKVVFYISPNAGEEPKPLADIVSSGEAARVMLALKKALIKVDPIPVLIFDEIDAQIGGRLGTITGQKLKEIAENRQVILITHLPQIASFADRHFKVNKSVKNKRALTEVTLLNKDQRVEELAAMMSGDEGSDIALKHAKDMLSKAKK